MATFRNRPPLWFWIVAVVLALWGALGIVFFYYDLTITPEMAAQMSDYDSKLLASRPSWFLWPYGAAVVSGFIGAVLLLLCSAAARAVYILSLVLMLFTFGYTFAMTDMLAVKGPAAAAMPLLVLALGIVQIWLAGLAIKRGWIA